ncbi:hypothetical protein M408DRAFT_325988 [Serendipita vermifera MAFF 305830]|uniref:Carbohydrate-binding module family 13 protein n=1 Tax=Serendipita vermifera MAFF 305830 TaxID=933852 RepID=A0A0C3B8Q7_SERVB|nr:hypothetical protein M408DRAFT_325988 [Serendipita vermifera MAFF 305830]
MNSRANSVLSLFLGALSVHAQYTATYDPNNLPPTTEDAQIGTNQCGTGNNQTSLCQNVYFNSVQDFCIWGPHDPNSVIGNVEQTVIAWCTKPGRGTRLIPEGTLKGVHFLETPDYIQITGHGNMVNTNVAAGDAGGELDPHGADGMGNPHGGLVFSNVWNNGTNGLGEQTQEWTNFASSNEFCMRVCKPTGSMPAAYCQHIYDVTGCGWNMAGDYTDGFTSCKGDSGIPMGLYPQPDGTTSTFHQGEGATPAPHPAVATSSCVTYESTALYASTAFATPTTTVAPSGTGTGTSTATARPNAAVKIGAGPFYVLATTLFGVVAGFSIVF